MKKFVGVRLIDIEQTISARGSGNLANDGLHNKLSLSTYHNREVRFKWGQYRLHKTVPRIDARQHTGAAVPDNQLTDEIPGKPLGGKHNTDIR
jgi:hypothetical protein